MSANILIVDDETNVRLNYRVTLETEGYKMFEAVSGARALEELLGRSFDLAILDMRMPGMDGWELQRITAHRFPELPVIFITAHQDDIGYRQASDLGAFGVLYKPFDGEELLLMVEAACKRYSQSGQLPDGLSSH